MTDSSALPMTAQGILLCWLEHGDLPPARPPIPGYFDCDVTAAGRPRSW